MFLNRFLGLVVVSFIVTGCQTAPESLPEKKPISKANPGTVVAEAKTKQVDAVTPLKPSELDVVWQRIRIQLQFSDSSHPDVQKRIAWYLTHPNYMEEISRRAAPYLYVARSVGDQLAGEYGLRGCPIRLPASFPQRLRGTIRGRPACWRIRPSGLPHSLASKLPTAALWHDPWETSLLANTAFGVAPFACQQASHSGFVARSVGDQLAGEYGLRGCPIRLPASFPSHSGSMAPFRGKLACQRIQREFISPAPFAAKAASHSGSMAPSVGSWLASESSVNSYLQSHSRPRPLPTAVP